MPACAKFSTFASAHKFCRSGRESGLLPDCLGSTVMQTDPLLVIVVHVCNDVTDRLVRCQPVLYGRPEVTSARYTLLASDQGHDRRWLASQNHSGTQSSAPMFPKVSRPTMFH